MGRQMPSGQHFMTNKELAKILNCKTVKTGKYGVFITPEDDTPKDDGEAEDSGEDR